MAEALPRSRCCCSIALSTASRSGMVTNLAMMGAGGDPLDWDGPEDSPFGLRRGNLWALIREIPAARLSSRPSVIKAFRSTSKTSSSWLSGHRKEGYFCDCRFP